MKSILLGAAAVAALTTFGTSAGAQPKPRFPIHREPAAQPVAPPVAPAPVVETPAEAEPVAAPTGEVVATALPTLQAAPVQTQPEPAPAVPNREPVLRVASAVVTAPVVAEAQAATPVYTMQSGDTLMGVTRRFKTTLAKLRALNGLTADASIKAGAKIRLPADATDTGAEPFARGRLP